MKYFALHAFVNKLVFACEMLNQLPEALMPDVLTCQSPFDKLFIVVIHKAAIKFLNDKVFVFLFLAHNHDIVESDSLHQCHNPNKAAEFYFRSWSYACGLCNILHDKIFRIFHASRFSTMDKCCILCGLSFTNTMSLFNWDLLCNQGLNPE